jgi:hypothetical protein
MMNKRKAGRKAARKKKAARPLKKRRAPRRKRAASRPAPPVEIAPAAEPKAPYTAPRRTEIKEAVCALLPHIDPRLIKRLDYWALYTIHQDVVKDGKDAEALARRLVRGYDPSKALPTKAAQAQAPAPTAGETAGSLSAKEEERLMRARELENRKMDARKRELAARERARVAKELARAKAQAAKARERAARDAARAKRRGASRPAPAPAAPAQAAAPPAPAVAAKSFKAPAGTYVAPVRTRIREELAKVMPMIKQSDLAGLDYWALYTMHSRICKYGDDPESMARKFVKGYKKAKK